MDEFEKQLDSVRIAVERFVRYRLPSQVDADDVLQEIYLTAYQRFAQLKKRGKEFGFDGSEICHYDDPPVYYS